MTTDTTPSHPFSGRTIFKVGIGLVLIAAGLFLRHSIDQGWIGPVARVALAAAGGGAMVATGMAVSRRRPLYGRLLQGAGVGVLFLTVYAAHTVVELTSTTEAYLQFVAVAALTLFLAIRERSEVLAGVGLTAAAAAPLVFGGRMAIAGEVGHLVIVAIVASVLAWMFGWFAAHSTTAVVLTASVWADVIGVTEPLAAAHLQSAITISWAMVVLVPLADAVRRRGDRIVTSVGTVVGSIGFHAATRWIWDDGRDLRWAALALGLAAVHLGAAHVLRRRGLTRLATLQWIPVVVLALAATAETLPFEWMLLGMAAAAVALVVGRVGPAAIDGGQVLYLVTALAAIGFVAEATERTPIDLVPGAGVLVAGVLIGGSLRRAGSTVGNLYLGVVHGASLSWMLVEFPRLGADGLSWVTAGWSVVGVLVVVIGRIARSQTAFGVGLATLGLAVGKLLLVDLATATPLTRIALFAGIGVLLLATGWWLGDEAQETAPDGQDESSRMPVDRLEP